MTEQWIKWEPVSGLASRYYIDAVVDKIGGFEILLTDETNEKKKIKVIFEHSVDAYRNTDESYRLKTIDELCKLHGAPFFGDWTFFKVTNSLYLQWLSEQSFQFSDELGFIHFAFVDPNSILDVVTTYEPKFEFI